MTRSLPKLLYFLLRQFHNFEICLQVEGHHPWYLASGISLFSDWFHVVGRAGEPKAERITLDLQQSGLATEQQHGKGNRNLSNAPL